MKRTPGCPFDPPPELAKLPPMARLDYPDGHAGWLATGYEAARAVLSDPRFSNRQELKHSAVRMTSQFGQDQPAPPGRFVTTDPPVHTRYRRLLTGQFTVRRMRLLEPRIEQITADHLDAMVAAGPPVDLVRAYALPIPSLVICELLGVPYEDHDFFQEQTARLVAIDEEGVPELAALVGYLGELVRRKRVEPGDDLISGLTGDLDDEELTNFALILLVAGHETTANMLGLGVFALLEHPEQRALFSGASTNALTGGSASEGGGSVEGGGEGAGAGAVESAVEELMRWLSILHAGAPNRVALEDVEVAGELVRKGETVALSLPAINRDPSVFADPGELRLDRAEARRHLGFGHGVHQCLGQQLARIEMRIGYRRLFERFPGLRLAVPASDVPLKERSGVYGVESLPVTW
ncbi:cytochrome P450 [Nonomuraea sp. NPDC050022]|uniref:cytochrome P450 n=1 Tax=Nonomuraea sp. NPDC050022 TaxID=3364358 RepID=UPI00378F07A9